MATATTTAPPPRISLRDLLTAQVPPGAGRAVFAAAILLAEVILAGALASGRLSITLMAFLAAGVLAIAFVYPMGTAVVALVLEVSVFYPERFAFSAGPLDANGAEMLLAALFVVALTKPKRRTWGGIPGVGLGVFLALLGISTALAVSAGDVDLLGSFAWGRSFLFFGFFYIVIRLFPDRDSIAELLGWAVAIAAVTGAVAFIVSFASGPGSFFQDPSQQFIRSEEGLGIIERVRLPGLSLAYALFWYAVVRTVQSRGNWRLIWGLALAGMFINIMVSFNRNMWIGLSIGLVAMMLLSGPQVRRRLIGAVAVIALAIGLLASQVGSDSRISPLVKRGTSLTNTENLEAESSLRSRAIETDVAIGVARENPIIGIGPGVDFGVSFFEATPGGVWVRVSQLFLHNQYLYIWLIAGLPALAAFLVYLLASLWRAWSWRTRMPETAAWGVGLASIMLSAIVAIYFSAPDMVLSLVLLTAAIYAVHGESESIEEVSYE